MQSARGGAPHPDFVVTIVVLDRDREVFAEAARHDEERAQAVVPPAPHTPTGRAHKQTEAIVLIVFIVLNGNVYKTV